MTDHETPPIQPIDAELARRLFHERIIVLGDELDQAGGNRLIAQLLTLAADDPRRDIRFWINSPGGSVPAMLAIMDVMRAIPNDVMTIAIGWAASAGQFLLTAGTPGKRLALPHARVLMHQGSAGIGGTAVDVELQADDLRYTRDTVLGITAELTGQPIERITQDSLRDRWYTAEQAIAYGFLDRVVDGVHDLHPGSSTRDGRIAGAGMSSYTIPYVVEKRGNSERSLDVYSRLLSERIVYLGTEIDDGVANVLIAQFLHLASESSETPISLYLNSPGGSPGAALAVYDTMQHIRPDVATTCVGHAGGPAAVLLAGGAKGRRAILPHGKVTLHQPSTQGRGTVPDLIIHADEVIRVRAELEAALAADTGRDTLTLRHDTDRDLILPAEAAVAYGLADHVLLAQVPVGAGAMAAR